MKRLAWLVAVAAMTFIAPPAQAQKARVVWNEIRISQAHTRPDLERHLRGVVMRQARQVDWGRAGTIEATIEVTDLSAVSRDGVVRVTCSGHGRLSAGQGGRVARSRFSMGGRPKDRAALERQILTMLGRGLVTRLADIAKGSR
jgi:hypothetical protein